MQNLLFKVTNILTFRQFVSYNRKEFELATTKPIRKSDSPYGPLDPNLQKYVMFIRGVKS